MRMKNRTAEYNAERAKIGALLVQLKTRLQKHGALQRKDAANWGYVGDLKHAYEQLADIVDAF